jgi:hypothetical protein
VTGPSEGLQFENQVVDVLRDLRSPLVDSDVQKDPMLLGTNRDGTHFARDQAERGLDDIKRHPVLPFQ